MNRNYEIYKDVLNSLIFQNPYINIFFMHILCVWSVINIGFIANLGLLRFLQNIMFIKRAQYSRF